MDGLKEFTTEMLEWVLENISARGHIITLLGFMPWLNIPFYDNNCIQQVTLQKEIVMGYPLPLLVVERIISHRATWVVFDNDRYLRKNTAYFANKIHCNTVMMSEKGEMDMIKGRPMINNGENTPGESPASVPTPLLICSEPLRRILEDQELEKYDDD
ncbi:hypothetical protein V6N13_074516 [Hibiscus sabdariffa]